METVPICVPLEYYLESHTEDDGFQHGPQSDRRTWPRLLDARRASKSHEQSQTIPARARMRPLMVAPRRLRRGDDQSAGQFNSDRSKIARPLV